MKSLFLILAAIMFGPTLANAQVIASSTVEVVAVVPSDCSVVLGTVPSSTEAGAIVRNPGTSTIDIPLTLSCSSIGTKVYVKTLNGGLKGESVGGSLVTYTTKIEGTGLAASSSYTTISTTGALNNEMTATNANGVLKIKPDAVQNLKADTYKDTLTISLGAP